MIVSSLSLASLEDLADAANRGKLEPYVVELPAVRNLAVRGRLELTAPVTFITGDNGSGKSTLLEALALRLGFDAFGGPRHGFSGLNLRARTGTESSLSSYLHVRIPGADLAGGFYLRAETQMSVVAGADAAVARASREGLKHSVSARSHGESVFDLLGEYVGGPGIYLLDEPEAGLSVIRQMALLAEIHAAAERGGQFIIATHSAILPAVPGADIIEVNEAGIMRVQFEEIESVHATREFFDDPTGTARFLIGE